MSRKALTQRGIQLAFLVICGLAWHWSVSSGAVSPLILPPLSAVWDSFSVTIMQGAFWPDLRVTVGELVAAFAIAAVSGALVGYLVSRSAFAVRVFDPLLASLYSVPTILLYPLYVLFFGIGSGSKIAIGATIAFFPVAMSTITALANVQRVYIVAARSMGARDWQLFFLVLLPASLPIVLAGLRLGMMFALLSILGTETIAAYQGIGHRIVSYAELMDNGPMFAWIFIAILFAWLLNWLTSAVESWSRRKLV